MWIISDNLIAISRRRAQINRPRRDLCEADGLDADKPPLPARWRGSAIAS